jgi:hypothetical protein
MEENGKYKNIPFVETIPGKEYIFHFQNLGKRVSNKLIQQRVSPNHMSEEKIVNINIFPHGETIPQKLTIYSISKIVSEGCPQNICNTKFPPHKRSQKK